MPKLTHSHIQGSLIFASTSFGEKVPFRRIALSDSPQCFEPGTNLPFYRFDSTGPFGQSDQWIPPQPRKRQPVGSPTQLALAKQGIITPEMAYVAVRENAMRRQLRYDLKRIKRTRIHKIFAPLLNQPLLTPEDICQAVAKRRLVIPANVQHPEALPLGIGKIVSTKVNANIGTSTHRSNPQEELRKLRQAVLAGADTVMDLSTGPKVRETRNNILRFSPVPIGTVPIYEALDRVNGEPLALSWDVFRSVLLEQARAGVDYMTIHAGLLARHIPHTRDRLTGIVSRGGGILATWMHHHQKENFLYEHFHRTAPQEFRCPTTSCPQPQLSCGCFLLSALNKSSGRLLPPVLLSVPLISGERVVQAMPTRGLSQSEKYRIIESTTEPCPSAPDLHGFRMPPGMVTQLLPWAACSNASQPFR